MTFPKIQAKPYRLINTIQNYAWGTQNDSAFIPRLLRQKAQPDLPYAELWMGAHPKAPSRLTIEGQEIGLDELIARSPRAVLGARVAAKFNGRLPYLFKVLSAGQALSIQAHPDKALAQTLHARDPQHYPDDNHKPEIAIALDHLTAVAGFKPVDKLLDTLQTYPEIANFIGGDAVHELRASLNRNAVQRSALKRLYGDLIHRADQEPDELIHSVDALAQRVEESTQPVDRLFLKLKETYPDGDAGLFSLFLFNWLELSAGEGIFIEAGVPHAYLKGNIIECMANSDNVVRAGLTPKFKDSETLVEMLTYQPGPPHVMSPARKNGRAEYVTPAREFQVSLQKTTSEPPVQVGLPDEATLMLILAGAVDMAGERFDSGDVVLIPACLGPLSVTPAYSAEWVEVRIP